MPRGVPNSKLIQPEGIIGTDSFPSQVEITESSSIPLGELVSIAFSLSELSAEDWNKLSAEERDKIINGTLEKLKAEAAIDTPSPDTGISLAHKMKEAGFTHCYKPNALGQTVNCGGQVVGPDGTFTVGVCSVLDSFVNENGLLQCIEL